MGYRKRRVEEDVGRGMLTTGTESASEGWGLEDDEGWLPLVVRERTNGSDAESDAGESRDPAESPGDSTSSESAPAADSIPATPEVSLDDLSDLVDMPEDDAIDELGDRIIKLSAHMSAAEHRLLLMIGEFDRREGWKRRSPLTRSRRVARRTAIQRRRRRHPRTPTCPQPMPPTDPAPAPAPRPARRRSGTSCSSTWIRRRWRERREVGRSWTARPRCRWRRLGV